MEKCNDIPQTTNKSKSALNPQTSSSPREHRTLPELSTSRESSLPCRMNGKMSHKQHTSAPRHFQTSNSTLKYPTRPSSPKTPTTWQECHPRPNFPSALLIPTPHASTYRIRIDDDFVRRHCAVLFNAEELMRILYCDVGMEKSCAMRFLLGYGGFGNGLGGVD